MFARLVVRVGMLMGLGEEGPARVIGWEEDWRSMVGRWSGGWRIEDDVIVHLGLWYRGGE